MSHEGVELRITLWNGEKRVTIFQGDCRWLREHCLIEDLVPPDAWHGVMATSEGLVIECRPVELEDLPEPPDDLSELGITEAEYRDKLMFRVHDDEHINVTDGGEDYYPSSNWG